MKVDLEMHILFKNTYFYSVIKFFYLEKHLYSCKIVFLHFIRKSHYNFKLEMKEIL